MSTMHRISPQTGEAFYLQKGDRLKVIDPEGSQVADLFCFASDDPRDTLSSGRTIDENETIAITTGHRLFSHSGRIMFEIIEDRCGRHDFLVTPCSLKMFQQIARNEMHHPSCHENLLRSFANFSVDPTRIGTTFNIFMRVDVEPGGKIRILPPLSNAGDYLLLEAKLDLVVGLTACSDEGTNGGKCKPIHYEIFKVDESPSAPVL